MCVLWTADPAANETACMRQMLDEHPYRFVAALGLLLAPLLAIYSAVSQADQTSSAWPGIVILVAIAVMVAGGMILARGLRPTTGTGFDKHRRPTRGWYQDPETPLQQRFWDGNDWTEHTSPLPQSTEYVGQPPRADSSTGYGPAADHGPASVIAQGAIGTTHMVIYNDGTFTTGLFGGGQEVDRLLGFSHEFDSMRRKSLTGRGTAALLTGGVSLAAANNRGVIYVTVVGARTGAKTYTTRNPSNVLLTSVRTLKAAADAVIR